MQSGGLVVIFKILTLRAFLLFGFVGCLCICFPSDLRASPVDLSEPSQEIARIHQRCISESMRVLEARLKFIKQDEHFSRQDMMQRFIIPAIIKSDYSRIIEGEILEVSSVRKDLLPFLDFQAVWELFLWCGHIDDLNVKMLFPLSPVKPRAMNLRCIQDYLYDKINFFVFCCLGPCWLTKGLLPMTFDTIGVDLFIEGIPEIQRAQKYLFRLTIPYLGPGQ